MKRLRFVLFGLRCANQTGEPLDLAEQEGLAEIIEDCLLAEKEAESDSL